LTGWIFEMLSSLAAIKGMNDILPPDSAPGLPADQGAARRDTGIGDARDDGCF